MDVNLKLDGGNLYKEESFTDMKVGAVRVLNPVKADGSRDENRSSVFLGQTQLMSPNGPLPVSCLLEVSSLKEAVKKFPDEMAKEVDRIVSIAQKAKQDEDSRIVVPGR
jgi:hypothetical protein